MLTGGPRLAGPRPAPVPHAVPQTDLFPASVAGVPGPLDDLDGDGLLAFARVWTTLTSGQIPGSSVNCPYSEDSWPRT